ncbi:hypothetical protein WJX73_000267 [Symbiochloris irregularis]|uniref:UAS domain-containing protein n=1 Tax=Symbiochloris irregularis TaxID=706552 RepID=A0AAW1PEC0_9CHLO
MTQAGNASAIVPPRQQTVWVSKARSSCPKLPVHEPRYRRPRPSTSLCSAQISDARFLGNQDVAGGPVAPGGGQQVLEALFPTPAELCFVGSYQDAMEVAFSEKRFIVVNVQDGNRLSSTQLNRDTWSDPEIREIIARACIFVQAEYASTMGQEMVSWFGISKEQLPCVKIIDHSTCSVLPGCSWRGFVSAARLLNKLRELDPAGSGARLQEDCEDQAERAERRKQKPEVSRGGGGSRGSAYHGFQHQDVGAEGSMCADSPAVSGRGERSRRQSSQQEDVAEGGIYKYAPRIPGSGRTHRLKRRMYTWKASEQQFMVQIYVKGELLEDARRFGAQEEEECAEYVYDTWAKHQNPDSLPQQRPALQPAQDS